MEGDYILERLDDFFSEGKNTDAVGKFLSEEQSVMSALDNTSDSQEGLEMYSLFKRYSALIDSLLQEFIEREKLAGFDVSLEQLAAAVLQEWEQNEDTCRYICTAYVAGALEFASFKELVADVNAMTSYPVGKELFDTETDSEETSSDVEKV